jgi:hypothetical protein
MKTVKIAGVTYPIILVDSLDQLDSSVEAVQCLHAKNDSICASFFHDGEWFSSTASSSMQAAVKIGLQVDQHRRDCAVRFIVSGVEYKVQSRHRLYDSEMGSESFAPLNTVHWWIKGLEGSEFYKCDIHVAHEDGEALSYEGIGSTLVEALADLAGTMSH